MEVHTLHTQTHTCTHIHSRTHTCLGWSALDCGTHTTHTYTHMHTHTHTCTHICRMKCTWLRYTHYIPIYPYRCKTMELTISQSGTKLLLACLLYTRLRRVCAYVSCVHTHTHTHTHTHNSTYVTHNTHARVRARTPRTHAYRVAVRVLVVSCQTATNYRALLQKMKCRAR